MSARKKVDWKDPSALERNHLTGTSRGTGRRAQRRIDSSWIPLSMYWWMKDSLQDLWHIRSRRHKIVTSNLKHRQTVRHWRETQINTMYGYTVVQASVRQDGSQTTSRTMEVFTTKTSLSTGTCTKAKQESSLMMQSSRKISSQEVSRDGQSINHFQLKINMAVLPPYVQSTQLLPATIPQKRYGQHIKRENHSLEGSRQSGWQRHTTQKATSSTLRPREQTN